MRTPANLTRQPSKSPGGIRFGTRLFTLIFGASSLLSYSAHASTYYWDTNGTTAGPGTAPSGTWTVGSNWNTDVTGGAAGSLGTVPTSVDDAYISAGPTGATTAYTVALGGATVDVNKLTMSPQGAAATIGSTIGDGTINIGIGGLSIGGTSLATINSNINLVGNQSWSYSGSANPTAFILNGAVGGTGNISFASNTGRAAILNGAINNVGSLTFGGGNNVGGVTINGNIGSNVTNFSLSNTGPLVLAGNNNYTGTTTVAGVNSAVATLRLGSNTALPTGTVVTLNSSAASSTTRFDLGNGTSSYNTSVAGLLSTATGNRQGATVVTNSDTTAGGAHTGTLTLTNSGANDFKGLIQDGANSKVALVMAGTGTLTLSGVSKYTGGTTVSSGTLVTNSAASTSATLTVGAIASGTATQTATVTSSAGLSIGQVISNANFPVGTYIIGINGNTLSLSQKATATGGVSTTFNAYQTLGSGAVTASGTGVLDLNASTTSSVGAVTVSGGTIQNGSLTGTSYALNSGTVSASLLGSGTLTKSGAGTLLVASSAALQNATGAFTVSAGTLSSNVANADLGGDLTLAGGTLTADGASVGSFTLASGKSFTMTSGTLGLTLTSSSSYDQIFGSGAGTFTLSGGILDLAGVSDYTASYLILSGFTSGSVSGISFANYDSVGYSASLSNAGVLSFSAVPEPSTYALLASGLGALFVLRRRVGKKA